MFFNFETSNVCDNKNSLNIRINIRRPLLEHARTKHEASINKLLIPLLHGLSWYNTRFSNECYP